MGLTIRSKFMSEEILKKRRQIIEKEKLHIQDELSKEEFENLYSKYGSGFDEKDFAWAFFDIDEAKFYNLEKRKIKKASILSYEYVSNEEFANIRDQVIKSYDLKHGDRRPYKEILENFDEFGGRLSICLFLEEILGIKGSTIKDFRKGNTANGTINFDSKPGEYNTFYKKSPKMPMYVLNPDYIYELRRRLFLEADSHIGDSVSYSKIQKLNEEYSPEFPENAFAQKVMGIGANSYNHFKQTKIENTTNEIMFQDVDIPIEYVKALTDKIAILYKLEAGQLLEREKFQELYDRFGDILSRKLFAVLVLEMQSKKYIDTIEKKLYESTTILKSRKKTDFSALGEKIVREKGLHHGDKLGYNEFKIIHELYAPNAQEPVFAEKALGIAKKPSFERMKYNGSHARIRLKLPTAEELKELQKKVILETGIKINDKLDYKEVERLHEIYGGILPIKMFATKVLGICSQSFIRIKNHSDKRAMALFNLVIPRSEIEKIREKIRLENNLPELKELTLEEIKELYTRYGGIMPPVMFAKEVLGVSADSLNDLKDKKCDTTMICIRQDFSDEEVKQLMKYLAEGLSNDEIATKMGVTVTFLKTNMNFLIDTNELTENNIIYEKVKLLNNQGKSPEEIIEELEVSEENVKEMLLICEKEEEEEEKRAELEIKQKKTEDRKQKKRVEIERKARKAVDDYEYKEKSIKNVRAYIKECKKDFEKGEFLRKDLEFLMECMIFVQCNFQEIELFSRICNYFSEYKMARDFILENIDNEDIQPDEKVKLKKCSQDINYAMKQDKALEMLRSGTQTIQQISNATGIREVDVIKLKRNLNEQTVSFLGNSNDDSSMSY